jgi:transcriptional regulator with GAF, ATPase, and Fis domain
MGERLLNLPPGGATLEDIEKEAILQALRSENWVQKNAGALLGISPRVMTYKIKKYGITKEN